MAWVWVGAYGSRAIKPIKANVVRYGWGEFKRRDAEDAETAKRLPKGGADWEIG